MADLKISQLTGASTPLAGTEVLPIVQSGSTVKVSVANLTAGRAVGMAGGSFTDNITQSTAAKGVNFTANTPAAGMTSQLLNWYEEGTWTPTDSSGEGLTLTAANAVYTRVGRLVTVSAVITYPATASALAMEMSGLPFTAGAPVSSGVLTNDNQTNMALVNTSNTYVRLYAVPNAAFTRTTNAQLSGKSIYLNITYPV